MQKLSHRRGHVTESRAMARPWEGWSRRAPEVEGNVTMELGGFETPTSWVRSRLAASTVQLSKLLICREKLNQDND